MISLYSGTPGSGKSLHIASKLYHWTRCRNELIIVNFKVNEDVLGKKGKLIQIDDELIDVAFLNWLSEWWHKTHKFKEGGITLIIDEAQLRFNSRDWCAAGRAEWLSFFAQHRHLGYDVILIAQFDRMLDRQIRSLLEYEYKHRRISNFGWRGKLISLFAGGKLFSCVKMWYPLKERIGCDFFAFRKKYGRVYDTHQKF